MKHPARQRPGLSVAVLAGGLSRRMGTDKALIALPPDGKTVLQRVLESASTVADELFVVAPSRPGYQALGVRLVPERAAGIGPLSGVEAALATARHDRCLVLACDLPLLSAALLAWLADLPCDRDALVPISRVTTFDPESDDRRRPQPLAAIYARRCLPRVSALIGAGVRRLSALLECLDVCFVEPDALERIDPDCRSFLNLNSPADLERVRRVLKDGSTPDGSA
jgi:molybdopterin-guanine dinucleotide biosynthesis protein A